ncbi:MAG TPA: hypothetical protein VF980_03340, partial [Thermoanaerobaculia bacterium]
MHAYGPDRLIPGRPPQLILLCPHPKPWTARTPKSIHSEHPGTAVRWDDGLYEVVAAEPTADGVRYVLEPWRDEHVIRATDAYDEASEARREKEWQAAIARNRGRKAANLLGIFTGHLPAVVQEHLASELGLLPAKLTLLSLLLSLAFLIWWANDFVRRAMNANLGPMPFVLILGAIYVFLESAIRLNIAWLQRRPVGSAAGGILYLLFYAIAGRRTGAISPFTVEKGYKLYFTSPDEETALRDAYSMREPLLTLLSPDEQNALAER